MASAIIHMAVASEINKILKRDSKQLLIGSIAPDISKSIGISKTTSHFIDNNKDIPNVDVFLKKYKANLSDDFVMGYFIHLYTDYFWQKQFITEFIHDGCIRKLDGRLIPLHGRMAAMYIYNDYANVGISVIKNYSLDLQVLWEEIPILNPIIEEISINKLYVLIEQTKQYISAKKKWNNLVFHDNDIINFIDSIVEFLISKIQELEIM